uniref:MICOS complex subunit MIC10 n=1 Tax=Meloidogyne incognita TaxID=6306 RepID=A0A914NQR4_MELIC
MSQQPEKDQKVEISEDVFGHKLDYCMADSVIKIASGAALGTIVSLVFSRAKKTWPIWLGTGIGIGMGWSNCKHEMQNRSWKCTTIKDFDNNTVRHECKGSSTGSFGSYGYSTFSGETKSSETKS